MNYQEAYAKLEKSGQTHVLKYYDELSDAEKAELIAQIEDTDFAVLENCKNLGDVLDYLKSRINSPAAS